MPAEAILEMVRREAENLGFDPAEVYEPYMLIDSLQQVLVMLQGMVCDGSLGVVAFALLLRAITWPWNVRALRRQCDRMELLPVYMELVKGINDAKQRRGGAGGGGARGAERAEADLIGLTARFNDFTQSTQFSPVQGMGYQIGILMPMYIVSYFALRGILGHPDAFREFVLAPALWTDSLVLPDPFGALPVVSAMAVLLNVEANRTEPQPGQEETAEYFRLVVRGASLTFVPLTTLLPSALLVFMATNATYNAAAMWTFRRYYWIPPRIEDRWRLPKAPEALKAPQA